ncbi:MAG TPA: MFS transporter [Patescibacteria group bacterium]|nr:MFS transporter [Patescibacteria group bacterium]
MRVNNLIKILTFSDVIILSSWGLTNPLFAVYVTQQIRNGSLETIGFATAIYWVTRSVLQLPFAKLIDSVKGEIDDFALMATGSLLMSSVPFLYFLATENIHVLLLQSLLGFASAMISPSWLAIFTRHIDKNVEAEEWGIYNAMVGLGIAGTGALGGFMAEKFGIRPLFLIVGVVTLIGVSFLFFVYQDLRMEEKKLARLKAAKASAA